MTEKFIVTEIESEKITVSPYSEDDFNTNGQHPRIVVINKKNLKISVGSIVHIGFQKNYEFTQGILTLMLPILFGLAGMLLSPHILGLFKAQCTETLRFSVTTVLFLLSAIVTRILNQSAYIVIKPIIIEIITES